jgi:hypothetical protein
LGKHRFVSCGNLFSYHLVPPLVSANDPMSAPNSYVAHYSIIDASFDGDVKREVDYRLFRFQQQLYATLDKELEKMPEVYSHLPYQAFFQGKTNVNSIKADAERLLWHQRLGHPNDYFLYDAYKFMDGVPPSSASLGYTLDKHRR